MPKRSAAAWSRYGRPIAACFALVSLPARGVRLGDLDEAEAEDEALHAAQSQRRHHAGHRQRSPSSGVNDVIPPVLVEAYREEEARLHRTSPEERAAKHADETAQVAEREAMIKKAMAKIDYHPEAGSAGRWVAGNMLGHQLGADSLLDEGEEGTEQEASEERSEPQALAQAEVQQGMETSAEEMPCAPAPVPCGSASMEQFAELAERRAAKAEQEAEEIEAAGEMERRQKQDAFDREVEQKINEAVAGSKQALLQASQTNQVDSQVAEAVVKRYEEVTKMQTKIEAISNKMDDQERRMTQMLRNSERNEQLALQKVRCDAKKKLQAIDKYVRQAEDVEKMTEKVEAAAAAALDRAVQAANQACGCESQARLDVKEAARVEAQAEKAETEALQLIKHEAESKLMNIGTSPVVAPCPAALPAGCGLVQETNSAGSAQGTSAHSALASQKAAAIRPKTVASLVSEESEHDDDNKDLHKKRRKKQPSLAVSAVAAANAKIVEEADNTVAKVDAVIEKMVAKPVGDRVKSVVDPQISSEDMKQVKDVDDQVGRVVVPHAKPLLEKTAEVDNELEPAKQPIKHAEKAAEKAASTIDKLHRRDKSAKAKSSLAQAGHKPSGQTSASTNLREPDEGEDLSPDEIDQDAEENGVDESDGDTEQGGWNHNHGHGHAGHGHTTHGHGVKRRMASTPQMSRQAKRLGTTITVTTTPSTAIPRMVMESRGSSQRKRFSGGH
eukprot:TRINITY_DN8081_c0_g1_i2.p1 TRINITY_DN8081_c0_g1~~TRINITY_DN8081_c0_g1_i2.p1  ORF type:complete len:729 (-),score=251.99 TRINITY_DN8081_c0_g1_i2:1852-4038(-)